jgi:hypothetical protein
MKRWYSSRPGDFPPVSVIHKNFLLERHLLNFQRVNDGGLKFKTDTADEA